MTPEEATRRIKEDCHTGDNEADHSLADEILCKLLVSLGHEEVVEAWEEVHKWYA